MDFARATFLAGALLLLVAVVATGCATAKTSGASGGITWRVADLQTEERPGRLVGYKDDGIARVYRYRIFLTNTTATGVQFERLDSLILSGPDVRPLPRTENVKYRLPPDGELIIRSSDSTWLVVPQWFEGSSRTRSLSPVVTKTLSGRDDAGKPVTLVIEFPPEDIPKP